MGKNVHNESFKNMEEKKKEEKVQPVERLVALPFLAE